MVGSVHNVTREKLNLLKDNGNVSIIIPFVREKGMIRCVAAIEADSSYNNYEIIAEYDKEKIGCPKMVKRLVEKTNYHYVCFLADDVVPDTGMLYEAMKVMTTFPDGVGLVGFNSRDFHCGEKMCTHWVASKALLPYLGGEFFCTKYTHNFCDTELVERCLVLNRYKYAPLATLTHYHPAIRLGVPMDEGYDRAKKNFNKDQCIYISRRNKSNTWKRRLD